MANYLRVYRLYKHNTAVVSLAHIGLNTFFTLERADTLIRAGTYPITYIGASASGRLEKCWFVDTTVTDPSRSQILIHVGNWAKQSRGCLLLGTGMATVNGELMVTNSRAALRELAEWRNRKIKMIIASYV